MCVTRVMAAEQHPIILVANKADMVRSRKVKASLGKELATLYSIKYIETSSGQSENARTFTVLKYRFYFTTQSSLGLVFVLFSSYFICSE